MPPNNPLNCYGNEKTMNLNHMILTNIQASPYFKVNLYELKTYHEVIDEIYYKVDHLEPWEKGSRKTAGQTGMCGGVRGVGAGGIVSSAYCLLYKLFTLKLTHKQVMGLLNHTDSPYIRGLGFMFIRYTQPPGELWDWYEEYLCDEEELDVRAGGGQTMTVGEMLRLFLTKLEWFSTLFPRIPVPIQKQMDTQFKAFYADRIQQMGEENPQGNGYIEEAGENAAQEEYPARDSPAAERPARPSPEAPRRDHDSHPRNERRDRRSRSREKRRRSRSKERKEKKPRSRSRERKRRSRSKEHRPGSKERRHRSRSRERRHRSRSHEKKHRSRSRDRKHRSRSRDRKKRDHRSDRESSFERDLKREKVRIHKQRNGK